MDRNNLTERAEVLVKETSFPAQEISEMTGIDVYQVFGMKLKARSKNFKPQTQRDFAQIYVQNSIWYIKGYCIKSFFAYLSFIGFFINLQWKLVFWDTGGK